MRQVVLLVMAVLCLNVAYTQQQSGILIHVKDSAQKAALSYASIILSNSKDSMVMQMGRTDSTGKIILKKPMAGLYQVHVYYSGYQDYVQTIDVSKEVDEMSFVIFMTPEVKVLEDVTVRNNVLKIRFKGDTIEYRADSFLTDKFANVEDLLKKLPGFYVDQQGRIQANGKKVEKVLIGGEEYFSEDPTLVTRSLRSEMVQKVQLYDQKSDQAIFSRIDDGKSVQTVNLELKPDKQKGLLGKAQIARAIDGLFDNHVMVSKFNGRHKIAGYLLYSNTGTIGLSWQDQRTYSDFLLNAEEGLGNSKPTASIIDNWDGQYHGQGTPSVFSSGVQYSNKTNSGLMLNGVGRYAELTVNSRSTSHVEYQLNDSLFSKDIQTTYDNTIRSGKGVAKATIPINSSSDIIVGFDVSADKKLIQFGTQNRFTKEGEGLLNSQTRTIRTDGSDNRYNGSLLWRKKIGKDTRLSLNSKYNGYATYYQGYISSTDTLFNQGGIASVDSIDQFKTDDYRGYAISNKATLTIPFSVKDWLGINIGYTFYENQRRIQSMGKDLNGGYSKTDSSLSNQYEMKGSSFIAGIEYGLKSNRVSLSLNIDAGGVYFSQFNYGSTIDPRRFPVFLPSATFTYSFSSQHKIVAYYSGQSIVPRVDQLQPIFNNTDPLNIQIGNPLLRPAFCHTGNVQYYWFRNENDLSISGGGAFHIYKDAFSTSESVDNFGKRTYEWINLNGNRDLNLFANIEYKPIKQWLQVGTDIQYNTALFTNVINQQFNSTKYSTLDLSFVTRIFNEDIFELESRITHRNNVSNRISPSNQYFSAANLIVQPSLSVSIGSRTTFKGNLYLTKFHQDVHFGDAQSISRFNASLSHRFLRQKQLEIKLSGFDILNNNRGVSRTVNNNYTSQSQYNTIGNYWQLSLQYFFSKTIKSK